MSPEPSAPLSAQLVPDLTAYIAALAAIKDLLDGSHIQTILPGPVGCQFRITFDGLEG